jgi:hypothetical protein
MSVYVDIVDEYARPLDAWSPVFLGSSFHVEQWQFDRTARRWRIRATLRHDWKSRGKNSEKTGEKVAENGGKWRFSEGWESAISPCQIRPL